MKESNTVTRTGLYINIINHTPHKQMKTECEIWGSFIFILPGLTKKMSTTKMDAVFMTSIWYDFWDIKIQSTCWHIMHQKAKDF